MNKTNGNTIIAISFVLILWNCIGCVTIKELPPSEGLTKQKIEQAWGRKPDKVYATPNKLNYGADELWIYKYPGGNQDRFYFKDEVLIKEEELTSGDF